MSRDKLVDVNDAYARDCKNVGCQGKSGPGKIHEVILVFKLSPTLSLSSLCCNIFSFRDDAEI